MSKMKITEYQAVGSPSEPPKKPPGIYTCPECGDAAIIWRTAVDEYKTKCPKCSVPMTRTGPPPIVAVPGASYDIEKARALDKLSAIYAEDKTMAGLLAAAEGIDIADVAFHYGLRSALTGFDLGVQRGQEEASGLKAAPSALGLLLLRIMHGESYIIGRQKGLSGLHGGIKGPSLTAALVEGVAG